MKSISALFSLLKPSPLRQSLLKPTVRKIFLWLVLCTAAFSFSGCYFFPKEEPVIAPPLKKPPQITYTTVEVKKGNIENDIRGTAYFVSLLQSNVHFTSHGGRVKAFRVKAGDAVRKGDILVELETGNLETQMKQQEIAMERLKITVSDQIKAAKMEYDTAKSKIDSIDTQLADVRTILTDMEKGRSIDAILTDEMAKSADKGEKGQESALHKVLISAKQQINSAQRNYELARLQLDDLKNQLAEVKSVSGNLSKELNLKDVLPGKDVEEMEDQIKQKEITLADALEKYESSKIMARLDVEGIESQLENTRKELVSATNSALEKYNTTKILSELDIKNAQFQLDNARQELEKSRLIAPVSGQVDYVSPVKIGDNINAYDELVRIADVKNLVLKYSDEKVSDFELGMKVEVSISGSSLDMDKDFVCEGEVVMNPTNMPVDANESLRDSVIIKVGKLPDKVRIGDSANLKVVLEKKDNVIVISKNYLHNFSGRKFVEVLENGLKQERDVETGIESPTDVEIVKGLEVGEQIIEE